MLATEGDIGGDPNHRGSPGGSPYHGFVTHQCNRLNTSPIGKGLRGAAAVQITSRGIPKSLFSICENLRHLRTNLSPLWGQQIGLEFVHTKGQVICMKGHVRFLDFG